MFPRPFAVREKAWLERLFDDQHRFSSDVHGGIERMLGRTITWGTGRAAALRAPSYGKTGTSQDSRDALFVGYSGDLVVGVWVGNDDNSPLAGASGGGLPARIWRDFMIAAIGKREAPAPRANPQGPVQPQDVTDIKEIPLGERARIRVDNGDAVVSAEIGGIVVDLRVNGGGIQVDGNRVAQELERLRDLNNETLQRARDEQRNADKMARQAMQRARERIQSTSERYEAEMRRSAQQ